MAHGEQCTLAACTEAVLGAAATSAGHLSLFYIVGGWQAGSLAPPGAHAVGLIPFGVDEVCAASAAADVPACRYMKPDAA